MNNDVQVGRDLGLWVLKEYCMGLSGWRKCYVGGDSSKQQKGRGDGDRQKKEPIRGHQ